MSHDFHFILYSFIFAKKAIRLLDVNFLEENVYYVFHLDDGRCPLLEYVYQNSTTSCNPRHFWNIV